MDRVLKFLIKIHVQDLQNFWLTIKDMEIML